jgi:hypothetical protein
LFVNELTEREAILGIASGKAPYFVNGGSSIKRSKLADWNPQHPGNLRKRLI